MDREGALPPAVGDLPRYVEGAAVHWHMVDLLWVVIFTLVYLVHVP